MRTVTLSDVLAGNLRRGPWTTAHDHVVQFYRDQVGPGPAVARRASVLEEIAHARSRFQVDVIMADARLLAPRASTWPRWERAAKVRIAELRGNIP